MIDIDRLISVFKIEMLRRGYPGHSAAMHDILESIKSAAMLLQDDGKDFIEWAKNYSTPATYKNYMSWRKAKKSYQLIYFQPCNDYRIYHGDDRKCPIKICKTLQEACDIVVDMNKWYDNAI